MKARIYKMSLDGKETADSYTVWFKPTKKAARQGCHINAMCCNVVGDEVWGYWIDYPASTRVGLDVNLGRRVKDKDIPEPIKKWTKSREKVFYKACETMKWDKWNKM